jgi:F0F1-type ATP synthase membrane subunit b/b'
MEQERVKDEVRQSIIEISSLMAQRFVARTMDNDIQDKLFTEVMAELGETDFAASGRMV